MSDRRVVARASPRVANGLERISAGRLGEDLDLVSEVQLIGEFVGATCRAGSIEASRISDARLTGSAFTDWRLTDVVIINSDLSGADLDGSMLTRVEIRDCRLSGAILARSRLRDVAFVDCRLDGVNFRMSEAVATLFQDVDLTGCDFYASRLPGACFDGCDMTGADITKADLAGAIFHHSSLVGLKGWAALAGAVIDTPQIMLVALGLLTALAITVDDDPPAA